MDKKKGLILGGVGLVVILLVFLLSGSSTRDMIIGKWEYRKDRIAAFYDDGTAMRYFVRDDGRLEEKDDRISNWILSNDEKTITITGGPRPAFLTIMSIDDNKLCFRVDKHPDEPGEPDMDCWPKYTE